MKEFRFNEEKNEHLKLERGIGFEVVIEIIKKDKGVQASRILIRKNIQSKEYF